MKNLLTFALCSLVALLGLFLKTETFANAEINKSNYENQYVTSPKVQLSGDMMKKTEQEYYKFIKNLEKFPINFVYRDNYYSGFSSKFFNLYSQETTVEGNKVYTVTNLNFRDELSIRIESALYPEYSAYDYTVYFSNNSNEDSGVIKNLISADLSFDCDGAILKGIYGDYDYRYAPYEFDLSKNPVNFTSIRGRATHTYFPYFNLEAKGNGSIIALGWGGTWTADFNYDSVSKQVNFKGQGTNNLCTYLKPGETIRTPLIGIVRYYDEDEDTAMNMWRRWYIDCNMPAHDASSDAKVQPVDTVYVAYDTGRFCSDGSIAEAYDSWYNSLNAFYSSGMTADFRWFDAGWYSDPYGNTVPTDWWGTVGTWEFDKQKWPDYALDDCAAYCKANGSDILLWFEPERVTHLAGMAANYGYDRNWVLSDYGTNNYYLNNLGIEECREWTLSRIIQAMEKCHATLYREDFNIDPEIFWRVGDGYQGDNRIGITENKYMQGHYQLWDEIIEFCADTGRCTFIDSCASGGGRNDLESMRRAVPFNRSDSDRAGIPQRLAYSTTVLRWLPYQGCAAKDGGNELGSSSADIYAMRSAMLPITQYSGDFYYNPSNVDWESMLQYKRERNEYEKYFYSDFYVLTPYNGISDTKNWTAYMYFNPNTDSGVISAFRAVNCEQSQYTLKVKGVNPNHYYTIRDVDGYNSVQRIKGSALIQGLPLKAKTARTALIIYIEPVS